ncbi:sigma-54-dependent Fis family transcriptional regulator [candidate division KSB1 bacterium]|nr:sigma-54-dependent Fis family transcriptional regulator [candidate division KSB1 bacterium]
MTADHQKWEWLIDLAGVLSQQNDFQEILRVVAQQAMSLLHAETALILMVNPRTRNTVKTVMREGQSGDDRRFKTVQNQISGWLMQNQQPLLSVDLKQDQRFSRIAFGDLPIKSVMGVPLRVEGALLGTLILLNKTAGESFSKEELTYLEKLALIAAPYLRNVQKIAEYFSTPLPEAALLTKYEQVGLIGKSPKFIELLQAIEAATRCDVRVLLEGQTGTGKEVVARAIHQYSPRNNHPFFAIDCGAIPANLIESELFGHVKGAFTGATQDRKGLLEEAERGTLFMDEIANLPFDIQAKFLRVLAQGEVRPLGSNKSRPIDVRLISASSQPLQKLVEKQQFREDLFYRLHVYPISVPSLHERQSDIPLLAHHFLKRLARQQQKQAESFHENLLDYMKRRSWEGNIRQLENFVERLVTLAPAEMKRLDETILPSEIKKEMKRSKNLVEEADPHKSLPERVAEYEARIIRQALEANGWSQSQAARQLRIPVQTLHYKMKKLGIEKV